MVMFFSTAILVLACRLTRAASQLRTNRGCYERDMEHVSWMHLGDAKGLADCTSRVRTSAAANVEDEGLTCSSSGLFSMYSSGASPDGISCICAVTEVNACDTPMAGRAVYKLDRTTSLATTTRPTSTVTAGTNIKGLTRAMVPHPYRNGNLNSNECSRDDVMAIRMTEDQCLHAARNVLQATFVKLNLDWVPKGCYTGPDASSPKDADMKHVRIAVLYNAHETGGANAADAPLCIDNLAMLKRTATCSHNSQGEDGLRWNMMNVHCSVSGGGWMQSPPTPDPTLPRFLHHVMFLPRNSYACFPSC